VNKFITPQKFAIKFKERKTYKKFRSRVWNRNRKIQNPESVDCETYTQNCEFAW